MAKILLIGCGDIGAAVAERLAGQGHQVTALQRNISTELSGVTIIKADVTQLEPLASLKFDYDQLVYIVAPSTHDTDGYKAVFDVGVNNVLEVLAQQAPSIAITFVSSTRVYGQRQGEWLNESSKTEPLDERGKVILAAEKSFLSFNQVSTIVRFSGIYGRSNRLLKQLKEGADIQQKPSYFTNRIHRDDCIGVLDFLINKKINTGLSQRIYLATDSSPVNKWELASYLCSKFGYPQPIPQLLRKGSDANKRLDNMRLRQEGYRFKFCTYKEGY